MPELRRRVYQPGELKLTSIRRVDTPAGKQIVATISTTCGSGPGKLKLEIEALSPPRVRLRPGKPAEVFLHFVGRLSHRAQRTPPPAEKKGRR